MNDFHRSFNNDKNKEIVNVKVSLDNALFPLKDEMRRENININIKGDILISLNIVFEEIKHIFSKLLSKSIRNFKKNTTANSRFIDISFENLNESIFITYVDNAKVYNEKELDKFFLAPNSITSDDFDLGFYLVKVFIEKNFGLISIEKTDDGIKYTIRFNK